MDNVEFRLIRRLLGLTQAQLAPLIGYRHATRVAECEREGAVIPAPVALLMRAYEDGYRPTDWARVQGNLDTAQG